MASQEAPLLSGQSASYGPPTDTQRVAVVQAPGGRCESDATAGEVQGPDLTGPRTCGCTLGMYNILVMAISFFFIFAAYNTLQNYATTILGSLGNQSLAVLYVSVCVVVPWAPVIVHRVGEIRGMIVGAALYLVYLCSLVHIVDGVVLFTSFLIGAGAAVLWVAQGAFLTKNSSSSTRGFNSGLFWSIFQTSAIVGNAAAYTVNKRVSEHALFLLFSITGLVGVVCLFLLKPLPVYSSVYDHGASAEADTRTHDTRKPSPYGSTADTGSGRGVDGSPMMSVAVVSSDLDTDVKTPRQLTVEMLQLFKLPQICLLLPAFFCTGYELSFWAGTFPKELAKNTIGLVLMFSGAGELLGGLCIGWLSDGPWGRGYSFLASLVVYGGGLTIAAFRNQNTVPTGPEWEQDSWMFFVASFMFGLADSGFNSQVYAMLGALFPHDSVAAFTVFQLLQNLGSAVGFYSALRLSLLVQVFLQGAVASLAAICFLIVYWRFDSAAHARAA